VKIKGNFLNYVEENKNFYAVFVWKFAYQFLFFFLCIAKEDIIIKKRQFSKNGGK